MQIIDPHIHLFNLAKGQYHWLKESNPPFWPDKQVIHRDFCYTDLALTDLKLVGLVHIEAGFDNHKPWLEIAWLEENWRVNGNKLPLKTVAFVDITLNSHDFDLQLKQLSQYKSVVGCRYILDEDAGKLLSDHQVVRNLEILKERDWLFELHVSLTDEQMVHQVVNFCTEQNTPKMIINHAGFPPHISDIESWQLWRKHLAQLAQFDHLAMKCSGWEMTERAYDLAWLNAVLGQVIHFFGSERTMLASNFPLPLFSQPYNSLWQAYTQALDLTSEQLRQVCHDSAFHWYRFDT